MNPEKTYRIIVSGGGTGGHLFPALAIAQKFRQVHPDSAILFVGALGKMEMRKVPSYNFKIKGLWIDGLHRGQWLRNFLLPLKIIVSFFQSLVILLRFQPDLVIGTGGYASFPIIFTASMLGKKTAIQEQNYFPGLTNRLAGRFAQIVFTPSKSLSAYFPRARIVATGNPVRADLLGFSTGKDKLFKKFGLDPAKHTILITGGSLGAKTLNLIALELLNQSSELNIQLIWQTGDLYYDEIVRNVNEEKRKAHFIKPFIEKMEEAYAISDWVIARAGAITLAELACMGKACILVPSPNVADDHQTKNALELVKHNAAIMLKDEEAPEKIYSLMKSLLTNPEKKAVLADNIKKLARPQALEHIIDELEKLLSKA